MRGTILLGSEDGDRVKPPPGCHCVTLRALEVRGLCSGWGRARGSGAPPALWMHSGVGEGRGETRKAGLILRLAQLFKI